MRSSTRCSVLLVTLIVPALMALWVRSMSLRPSFPMSS